MHGAAGEAFAGAGIEDLGQADEIAVEGEQLFGLVGGEDQDQAVDFYFCPSDGFKLWLK